MSEYETPDQPDDSDKVIPLSQLREKYGADLTDDELKAAYEADKQ